MKRFVLHYAILAVGVTITIVALVACSRCVQSEQHKYRLGRQLIAAVKRFDYLQAIHLVEAGADPNTRVNPDPPPTWQDLLQQFRDRHPRPANQSPTALMIGFWDKWYDENGHFHQIPITEDFASHSAQLTLVMLEHGLNVDLQNDHGETAFILASSTGATKATELLLEHGADINHQNDLGYTALHYQMTGCPWVHMTMIKLLLRHHPRVGLRNKDGLTPLGMLRKSKLAEAFPQKTGPVLLLLKQAGDTE